MWSNQKKNGDKFALTPMLEEAQRQMNVALRPEDDDPDGDVTEIGHLEG